MPEYPINDHRPSGIDIGSGQPEVCDICGMPWPGSQNLYSNVEGLRGYLVCGSTRTKCAHFRSAVTHKDRFRQRRKFGKIGSGKHPVFPPGAKDWWDDPV